MSIQKIGKSLALVGVMVSAPHALAREGYTDNDKSTTQGTEATTHGAKATTHSPSASHQALTREDVRQIQLALQNSGQDPGPIDGIFGPATRRAMRAFQSAHGISATGQADQQSLAALKIGEESGIGAAGGRTTTTPSGSQPDTTHKDASGSTVTKPDTTKHEDSMKSDTTKPHDTTHDATNPDTTHSNPAAPGSMHPKDGSTSPAKPDANTPDTNIPDDRHHPNP